MASRENKVCKGPGAGKRNREEASATAHGDGGGHGKNAGRGQFFQDCKLGRGKVRFSVKKINRDT